MKDKEGKEEASRPVVSGSKLIGSQAENQNKINTSSTNHESLRKLVRRFLIGYTVLAVLVLLFDLYSYLLFQIPEIVASVTYLLLMWVIAAIFLIVLGNKLKVGKEGK